MNHQQRAALRADREAVLAAAAWLRHAAVQRSYAGLDRPEHAFSLASMLEMFAIRIADQDPAYRLYVVRVCRELVGDGMDRPTVRRTRRR
ncbi:hypothetical protein [Pseudonocardia endophytica]|uniref:Uncharacterized protein n=1 Tax=Pseudonocardia endophytica TaxID=401976 RepID=A0A4R1HGJ3_PSEEN|nr:hypothetical protein [Pseudonocardia endophytica]TCK19873.1 hypothetical protein EV378_3816 [Pseudonocardia endophytica]